MRGDRPGLRDHLRDGRPRRPRRGRSPKRSPGFPPRSRPGAFAGAAPEGALAQAPDLTPCLDEHPHLPDMRVIFIGSWQADRPVLMEMEAPVTAVRLTRLRNADGGLVVRPGVPLLR